MATMALTVLSAAGVALAAEIQCSGDVDCFGTNQADTLTGTAEEDTIYGLGGPDLIYGLGGGDSLYGGSGGDEIRGGADPDIIVGGGGADELRGGDASDELSAGNGDDTVLGGPSVDFVDISGDQQYGFQDEVFCGAVPGDIVEYDANDILHGDCRVL